MLEYLERTLKTRAEKKLKEAVARQLSINTRDPFDLYNTAVPIDQLIPKYVEQEETGIKIATLIENIKSFLIDKNLDEYTRREVDLMMERLDKK